MDVRTRLLLSALTCNGVKMVVSYEHDVKAMQEMVKEGLFTYSTAMFSQGYWWTEAGEKAAKKAWRQLPVVRFKTRYRNHPKVKIGLNGHKEEVCEVMRPKRRSPGLRVRESLGKWLIDHPNGLENVSFKSADEAIEWALEQMYGPGK